MSKGAGDLANMFFFTFFFISLLAVNVLAKKKCQPSKYQQHSSGSASFTVYTGCAETGDDDLLSSETTGD